MRRLGALLVCACLFTAGCIGDANAGTASETREEADEHAERFAGPDAELIQVSGAELNTTELDGGDSNASRALFSNTDETIGDGEAPAWMYTYQTSELTYQVTVAHDGTVLANESTHETDEDATPIGDWEVDSEEAAEIVDENNDTWSTDTEGVGFYGLERDNASADPVWGMAQFTKDHALVAAVNATTGEYLGAQAFDAFFDFDFDFDFNFTIGPIYGGGYGSSDEGPPQEGGTFEGSLSAAEPTAEHTFEVDEEGHPDLGVALELEDPSAGSTVNATVEGPSGTLGSFEATSDHPSAHLWTHHPPEGDYTVTLELTEGVGQDYTVAWCAEGESSFTRNQGAEEACETVEDA